MGGIGADLLETPKGILGCLDKIKDEKFDELRRALTLHSHFTHPARVARLLMRRKLVSEKVSSEQILFSLSRHKRDIVVPNTFPLITLDSHSQGHSSINEITGDLDCIESSGTTVSIS